jgi:hypothetical protein
MEPSETLFALCQAWPLFLPGSLFPASQHSARVDVSALRHLVLLTQQAEQRYHNSTIPNCLSFSMCTFCRNPVFKTTEVFAPHAKQFCVRSDHLSLQAQLAFCLAYSHNKRYEKIIRKPLLRDHKDRRGQEGHRLALETGISAARLHAKETDFGVLEPSAKIDSERREDARYKTLLRVLRAAYNRLEELDLGFWSTVGALQGIYTKQQAELEPWLPEDWENGNFVGIVMIRLGWEGEDLEDEEGRDFPFRI